MRKPIWVDFIRFDSLADAARYVSKQLKGEVAPWQLQAAMDHHYPLGGMWIRDEKPAPGVQRDPLLHYPSGEAPIERGLPEAWR